MDFSPKEQAKLEWAFNEWADKLVAILESMADERPKVERKGTIGAVPPDGALIWEQAFSPADQPFIWVAAPEDSVIQIGERTLRASGVETMDAVDARNTFLEVLSQSLSALGQSFSAELGCDSAAAAGGPADRFPSDLHCLSATLTFADRELEPIWIGFSEQLLHLLVNGAEVPEPLLEQAPASQPAVSRAAPTLKEPLPASGQSKTFDLLLDVSLSVSVSFGRTFLPIKEVLKLTTGSIVELDRGVNEPVEIIVNNCVIARGEVVVVEGNYGVRINQIASRHDRLKTGSTAVEAQHALSAR